MGTLGEDPEGVLVEALGGVLPEACVLPMLRDRAETGRGCCDTTPPWGHSLALSSMRNGRIRCPAVATVVPTRVRNIFVQGSCGCCLGWHIYVRASSDNESSTRKKKRK